MTIEPGAMGVPRDGSSGDCDAAIVVVAVALVDGAGRVLVQCRPAGRDHAGLWEFPGGKLEPAEGPLAALSREAQEELAIAIDSADCVPLGRASIQIPRPLVLLMYGCNRWRGDPVSQENAQIAWHAPAALAALAMPPLDIPLVPLVIAYAASIMPAV